MQPPPAPPGHTPADGHIHLQHRRVVPLQGRQAAEQVGGPQVEEADHHGQGQQRPLLLDRHRALQEEGWRRSRQVPRLWGGQPGGAPDVEGGGQTAWQHLPPSPRHAHPGPPLQTTQEGGGDTGVRKRNPKGRGSQRRAQAETEPPGREGAEGGGQAPGARPNSAGV